MQSASSPPSHSLKPKRQILEEDDGEEEDLTHLSSSSEVSSSLEQLKTALNMFYTSSTPQEELQEAFIVLDSEVTFEDPTVIVKGKDNVMAQIK